MSAELQVLDAQRSQQRRTQTQYSRTDQQLRAAKRSQHNTTTQANKACPLPNTIHPKSPFQTYTGYRVAAGT
jgi:hypothetical protein